MTDYLEPSRCPPGLMRVFERSANALTLADMSLKDQPLIAVNEAFCRMVGYDAGSVLGRNCRFLQPPGGAGPVRQRIRAYIDDADAQEARFVIANCTRTGAAFLNIVYMAKLRHPDGRVLILGSQFAERTGSEQAAVYEEALRSDLTMLSQVMSEGAWMLMGSMQAVANSTKLLAQHYLESGRDGDG